MCAGAGAQECSFILSERSRWILDDAAAASADCDDGYD